jgi:flagella basal body P-ring formation protein FlgA
VSVTRLLALLLLAASSPAGAQGLVVLREHATVSGPVIALGDVARIDGLPEAQAVGLAALEIGRAPQPGRERSLSGATLRQLVARHAPGVQVEAPEHVRVDRARRGIEPEQVRARLEEAIRQRMPWPPDAVELRNWRLPERFDVSPGATRTIVRFRPDEDFSGPLSAELEFVDPADPAAPALRRSAGVSIAVWLPVVVLAREARRGEPLDESQLELARRELSRVPRGALRELADALGQRPARDLASGQVLVREALALEPVVQRGDTVVVEGGSGALEVRVLARALERGAPGQQIRLENPSTRQRLEAEVTGPGAARLLLPGVGAGQ